MNVSPVIEHQVSTYMPQHAETLLILILEAELVSNFKVRNSIYTIYILKVSTEDLSPSLKAVFRQR